MLIGWVVGVVVVVGAIALVLLLRRSREDVHSVEHYHRQLHTLEEMRTHPTGEPHNGSNGSDDAQFPASAFRVSGSSTVRLTDPGRSIVPPVPPPPVPNPDEPVTFDDAGPEPVPATFMTGNEDRVIHSINHRPRRLAGPAAAVAAVLVLIAVLIVTGLHSDTPKRSGKPATATTTPAHTGSGHHHAAGTTTTSTTAPPAVSPPTTASAHAATYTVNTASYTLNVAATIGECWVEVTNTTTGSVLFTGTLQSGQSHNVSVTGPATVIAGAPGAFSATVDGAPVALPPGNQAPFTLTFQPAATPTA